MLFSALGLPETLLQMLDRLGYAQATPIQQKAIPEILQGHDVLAAAQTGTGKTAAFTLPLLARLLPLSNRSASPAMHPVRALILAPTRELADQVADNVAQYSAGSALRHAVIFGGVPIEAQKTALRAGVEIIVATPGRLLDHLEQKTVQLNRVDLLVLDEADRMLDMGFLPDIRRIVQILPATRQTLLFSATFSPEIKTLSEEFLRAPKIIEVARDNATNTKIVQQVFAVDSYRRLSLLIHLLHQQQLPQCIIFCRTKIAVDQLTRDLQRANLKAEALHGDKSQQARLDTLAAFKDGRVSILVATDVAARGLDISGLPLVVNFELPKSPEDYVHRIGRTGRAGSEGLAISLMCEQEKKALAAIEALTKQSLTPQTVDGFFPSWLPKPERAPESSALASPKRKASRVAVENREIPALLRAPVR